MSYVKSPTGLIAALSLTGDEKKKGGRANGLDWELRAMTYGMQCVVQMQESSNVLKKPSLMKTVTCNLDKLSLQLYPTLEKFEEELVELLNADRLLK
eukprot:g36864.t1